MQKENNAANRDVGRPKEEILYYLLKR